MGTIDPCPGELTYRGPATDTDIQELEEALEFVEHGHAFDCATDTPDLQGNHPPCNCGRDGIANRIRELFRQRVSVAEVREMLSAAYVRGFNRARQMPAGMGFRPKHASRYVDAILKEHGWHPNE